MFKIVDHLCLLRVQLGQSVKLVFQDLKDLKAHKARVVAPSWDQQYDASIINIHCALLIPLK